MKHLKLIMLSLMTGCLLLAAPGVVAATDPEQRVDSGSTELVRTRVQLKGAFLAKQVDSHLKQNDLVLMAVGDFLSANPDVSPEIAHSRMKRYQRVAAGLRSILAIGPDGTLLHDSYNLPAPDFNLGDRIYVREAVRQGTGDLRINAPVAGRQSGIPFIPLTRGQFDVEGNATGVIVGILGPETLLPEDSDCALCVSAVMTRDMDILVSRPSGLTFPADLISQIRNSHSANGLELINVNGSKSLVSWTKNIHAGVVTVSAELLPGE
tara:strand:- start:4631 stop:5428 length:798 start_codon:yes stop_codon:yes gene_type:complete